MNPNAAQFSPSSIMVEYGSPIKANGFEDRPQDMIMHESIKQLVQDVSELKLRTETLEQDNKDLQQEISLLKLEIKCMKQVPSSVTTAPAVKSNLTGYAGSEASSTDFTFGTAETVGLENRVEEQQTTVTQILEKFDEHLETETTKREELTKDVNEYQYILKNVKARTGVLEHKFKTMAIDLEELEVVVQNTRNKIKSPDATTNDGVLSMNIEKLEKFEASVVALEADMAMHSEVLNELVENAKDPWAEHNKKPTRVVAPHLRGNGGSASPATNVVRSAQALDKIGDWAKLGKMNKEFIALKQARSNRISAKRDIDGCPTKDALYEMYHGYTDEIEDAEGDKLEDLWELRDRVVVRLALFDVYGKALKEAKAADVGDI